MPNKRPETKFDCIYIYIIIYNGSQSEARYLTRDLVCCPAIQLLLDRCECDEFVILRCCKYNFGVKKYFIVLFMS